MDKKLFQYPEDDFFIEGKDNGFRPLAFSNSRDELLEIKKYLNRARG
ncbi:hypothetical protein J9A42_29700 [Klebsiella pneumoniae]